MFEYVNYVVDAGAVNKGKFHWVSSKARSVESNDIAALVVSIVSDIRSGHSVTLGVECPLFLPCPDLSELLGTARKGECTTETGNKPFTASAGACAAITGIQAIAWVLREIHRQCRNIKATTRWEDFAHSQAQVFVWEAFVSGSEKGANHHEDATLALDAFEVSIGDLPNATRVHAVNPINLAAMLLLWVGMSDDVTMLHTPCIVLRPIPNLQVAGG